MSPHLFGHRRRRFDSDVGASLVEVIVAATILGTGVIAMAQLFSIAAASNVMTRGRTVALILAQQKLEELRSVDPASTPESIEHLTASGAVAGTGSQPPRDAVYTRRWSVEPTTSGPHAVLLRVRVTIRGAGGDVEIATVMTRATE